MSEDLTIGDARAFIERSISPIHRPLALQALEAPDNQAIEQIGLTMAGEQKPTGFVLGTGAPAERSNSLWRRVVEEVYEFFCTRSKAYSRERSQGVSLFEHAVTVVATALASTVKLGLGLVTALVTIAVLAVAKMGRNAWCKWSAGELQIKKS